MPRRKPPEGFITAGEALEILGPMLYKYVARGALKKYGPDTLKHKYYKLSEVEAIRSTEEAFFERGEIVVPSEKNITTFARATPADMDGVYMVAASLFPHGTTSAEARRPLVEKCPDGNYIVKEHGEIVAYIHLQPLKHDRLQAFMRGEIRGKDITADDLDCFAPGKTVDVLIKSVGATRKYGETKSAFYIQRLLLGTAHTLGELGRQGVIIRRIYATSETPTGIALSMHAKMQATKRLARGQHGDPDRWGFVLDVATSDLPLLKEYQQALTAWKEQQG